MVGTIRWLPYRSHKMTRHSSKVPNLDSALVAAQMTPADLARATGWSEAKVSRIRSGKQGVSVEQLRELEKATGASASFLLGRDDFAQSEDERRLLENYRAASAKNRGVAQAALEPDSSGKES